MTVGLAPFQGFADGGGVFPGLRSASPWAIGFCSVGAKPLPAATQAINFTRATGSEKPRVEIPLQALGGMIGRRGFVTRTTLWQRPDKYFASYACVQIIADDHKGVRVQVS